MEEESIVSRLPAGSSHFFYQLSLRRFSRNSTKILQNCGAGIIGDFHIITAANCILNTNGEYLDANFLVEVRSIRTLKDKNNKYFSVSKYYVPSAYRYGGLQDIAILKVRF